MRQLKKTHDLDKEIQQAFDYIDGDIVSYEEFDAGTDGEKVRDGEVVEKHSSPYIWGITTNTDKKYRIIISNREICRDHPEYEGFSEILILYEDSNLVSPQ